MLVMVLGMPGGGAFAGVSAGQAAPEFSAVDTTGTEHSLSQFKGRFVVLEWFNPDCPFVKKHYGSGNMQRLQETYTGRGIVWLTVASSAPGKQGHLTAEAGNAVIAQRGSRQTALLLDAEGRVGRLYGAKTTPHLFIVNPEGTVIYAGAIDDTPSADPADIPDAVNYVQQALDQAMAGEAVAVPQTTPYGCSVKY
jgi:peroxiredoxin